MNIHDYRLFSPGLQGGDSSSGLLLGRFAVDRFAVMRVDAVPFEANSTYYDLRDDVPFLHLDAFGLIG